MSGIFDRIPRAALWIVISVLAIACLFTNAQLQHERQVAHVNVMALCKHIGVTDSAVNNAHGRIRKLISKGLHDTEARIGTKKELPTDKRSVPILVDFLKGIHTINSLNCSALK